MRAPQEVSFFRVLIAGFTLLIGLLATSVYISVDAMRSTESDTARLLAGQRATLRLIDDVQQKEDSLSAVFYALAAGPGAKGRAELLNRLNNLEKIAEEAISAGLASGNAALWGQVRDAAANFITVGRTTLTSGKPPSLDFYRAHEALINALGDLAAFHFDAAAAAQKRETESAERRVLVSAGLLAAALVIALGAAFFTVRIVGKMYRQLQFQTEELTHLSSRTMADQEETARRFSRELHDEFGQNLSALEANLVAIQHARVFHENRVEDCLALVKQAIANTRELSHLLRPSVLDDFGLEASLRWLVDRFSQRTGIQVDFQSPPVGRLPDEVETQLFRIVQEALTNVSRHACATNVGVELQEKEQSLLLTVSDNGKGILNTGATTGLGLVGMRARARAAGGKLQIDSESGRGVTITVQVPITNAHAAEDTHTFGR
ncbi:MAG: sensor histidine kinase [Bryobacteraceae bacterium]